MQEFRSRGGLRALESSAKEREDRGWAHRARNRTGERHRRAGGELGRSSWTEIGEDAAAGVLRLLDSVDHRVEGLRGSHGGQRGSGVGGGEKTGGGPNSPMAALRRNSGAVGVRGRGQRLGEVPGAQAKLRRGSSVDVVQRGGWSTAAQGVLRGGAVQGVRISGLWAHWSGWCGAEGLGRCLKEGAEDHGRACPA